MGNQTRKQIERRDLSRSSDKSFFIPKTCLINFNLRFFERKRKQKQALKVVYSETSFIMSDTKPIIPPSRNESEEDIESLRKGNIKSVSYRSNADLIPNAGKVELGKHKLIIHI